MLPSERTSLLGKLSVAASSRTRDLSDGCGVSLVAGRPSVCGKPRMRQHCMKRLPPFRSSRGWTWSSGRCPRIPLTRDEGCEFAKARGVYARPAGEAVTLKTLNGASISVEGLAVANERGMPQFDKAGRHRERSVEGGQG